MKHDDLKNKIEQKLDEINNLSGLELLADNAISAYHKLFAKIFAPNVCISVIHDTDADGLCAARIWRIYAEKLDIEYETLPLSRTDRNPIEIANKIPQNHIIVALDCGSSSDWSLITNDIFIIDHHVPHEHSANVILLNPTGTESSYCASSLIYKLMEKYSGIRDDEAIQYAAIGSVADMVPLLYTTRKVVKNGLWAMNKKPVKIAKALKPMYGTYTEKHIGFYIAPTINAGSRMNRTEVAIDAIVNEDDAAIIELKKLNTQRKNEITKCIDNAKITKYNNCIIVEITTDTEISGLVATKILNTNVGIVAALCIRNDNASLRSIEGLDVQNFISSNDNLSGGGHKNAAGCTFNDKSKLIQDFVKFCESSSIISSAVKEIDLIISGKDIKPARAIMKAHAPYGMGFRPLLFSTKLTIKEINNKTSVDSGYAIFRLADQKDTFYAICYSVPIRVSVGNDYIFEYEFSDGIIEIKNIREIEW